jgi:hypothetical protein
MILDHSTTLQTPTCAQLFKEPLVYGVTQLQLAGLVPLTLGLQALLQGRSDSELLTGGLAFSAYSALRLSSQYGYPGQKEAYLGLLEKGLKNTRQGDSVRLSDSSRIGDLCLHHFDTLTRADLKRIKDLTARKLDTLSEGQSINFAVRFDSKGDEILHTLPTGTSVLLEYPGIYSLIRLPLYTGPTTAWDLTNSLASTRTHSQATSEGEPKKQEPSDAANFAGQSTLNQDHLYLIRLEALPTQNCLQRIEKIRRRTSGTGSVTFTSAEENIANEAASQMAELLASGREKIYQMSVVLALKGRATVKSNLFIRERFGWAKRLALQSVLGERVRFHRSHLVRTRTAADFLPEFGDDRPTATLTPVFETRRGKPLAIDLQSPDLPALHINVSGTTGSGKSVAAVALLTRLQAQGVATSVFFLDQLFSFRRTVIGLSGVYLEPESLEHLKRGFPDVLRVLDQNQGITGVELSELPMHEIGPAIQWVLAQLLRFLKTRQSLHPVYIVMDESWRLLKEEPTLLQTLFRECRKLDGAAVAITQSLTDLLRDPAGQAVFQNTPIQLVLRQREDPARIKGDLGLNEQEAELLRSLELKKGEFTELLIKLPSKSYLARLRLTATEHELFRTDTIRKERVAALRSHASESKIEDWA